MKSFSLRVQVFIIVGVLALGVFSATIFIANAVSSARESIIRLSRERLSSLTEELSRRYGSVVDFISPDQFDDTTLAKREELATLLTNITREELAKAPDAEAGFFHWLWNREVGFVTPASPTAQQSKAHPPAYARLLSALQQTTIEEQQGQWSHHESEGSNFIIVTKPVFARERFVGVAWAYDDLGDELAETWTKNVTPLLQLVVLLGILLATFFVLTLRREVSNIQSGLNRMKEDLSARLPVTRSELGSIARSINDLANTITQQQQEKEALQKTIQQKEKLASLGQLIAGVAHEIRTPLAAIKTRVQLWQRATKGKRTRSASPPATTPESMALVVRELDRMEKIVQKLLYFSKERTLRLQSVDIHTLLDSSLEMMQEDVNKHRVTIRRNYGAADAFIDLDESEMREVFLNLLTNALEAMPEGGTLNVQSIQDRNELVLIFQDSGAGIKPDIAAKMFDPFFTTKETGTGLGLSIAYEIVRAHQGKLEYTGTNKSGARFEIRLPHENRHNASSLQKRTTQKRT